MGSDPVICMRLAAELKHRTRVVADTIAGLKAVVGMDDVTDTQFEKALRSLGYNSRVVRIDWPREIGLEQTPYRVSYRTP